MSEDTIEKWVVGRRYERGARVLFRDRVWVAQHYTELRPGLGKAWRAEGANGQD